MAISIARPQPEEIPEFFRGYVGEIAHQAEGLTALEHQRAAIAALGRVPADRESYRYPEGKWSVQTPLPPFDENAFAERSNADRRALADLVRELSAVRESSLALVRSLDEDMLAAMGTVRAGRITARAQVFVIAGHAEHHLSVLRHRYGLTL